MKCFNFAHPVFEGIHQRLKLRGGSIIQIRVQIVVRTFAALAVVTIGSCL